MILQTCSLIRRLRPQLATIQRLKHRPLRPSLHRRWPNLLLEAKLQEIRARAQAVQRRGLRKSPSLLMTWCLSFKDRNLQLQRTTKVYVDPTNEFRH